MTNRATRRSTRKAAQRPPARTVTVTLDGAFDGWEATARADFPAGTLVDLASGDVDRIIGALDVVLIDHNMPDSQDQVAATMRDVDPYDGLLEMAGGIFDAIGKLPNR